MCALHVAVLLSWKLSLPYCGPSDRLSRSSCYPSPSAHHRTLLHKTYLHCVGYYHDYEHLILLSEKEKSLFHLLCGNICISKSILHLFHWKNNSCKKKRELLKFQGGFKILVFPLITGISLEILGKKHNCILHTFNQICWNEHRSTPYRQRHLVIVLEFNRFWLPSNALGIYL